MEEQEEHGRDFTGKYVTPNCFSDENLRATLSNMCEDGTCSYTGVVGNVVSMNSLRDYLRHYIFRYFDNPDNCDLYLANSFIEKGDEDDKDSPLASMGPYLVTKDTKQFETTEDLLNEVKLMTRYKELNKDLVDVFGEHWWVEKETGD